MTALTAAVCASCSFPPSQAQAEEPGQDGRKRVDLFFALESRMKFHRLDEIRTDTMGWMEGTTYYAELDSVTFAFLWPDSSWNVPSEYDRTFLHGWHRLDDERVALTFVVQEEATYCRTVICSVRDGQGRQLANFVAAERCGDGGWTCESWGRWTGARDYERITVNQDLAEVDTAYVETYEGDSTWAHISFKGKEQLIVSTLRQVKFTRVEP